MARSDPDLPELHVLFTLLGEVTRDARTVREVAERIAQRLPAKIEAAEITRRQNLVDAFFEELYVEFWNPLTDDEAERGGDDAPKEH